ncbi:MAG TPA: flagellar hook-associated protein FlgL, partial [Planctomycetota bacterium]|nr:flagellar hook-associated protein FlgL [Planctomycetota bacterium]
MSLRPTQSSNYDLVAAGIKRNLLALVRAQEQVSSGQRILRPSDDAVGTSRGMSLTRQRANVDAHLSSVTSIQPVLATSTTELENASGLLTEARALVLQAMNGTLSDTDRATVADQLDQIAESLFAIGNTKFGDRYLFAGSETSKPPFVDQRRGVEGYVQYQGDTNQQQVAIGRDSTVDINLPGNQVFGGDQYRATAYTGQTGIANGDDANYGKGYMRLFLRTDTVTGANVGGLAMGTAGGTSILGSHVLQVNGADGTAQLGTGPTKLIPTPPPANFTLVDEDGSVAVLDFSGWTGGFVTTTLVGEGSISTDGTTYNPFDRNSTNIQVTDPSTGNMLHVDGTGVHRAGSELVVFQGATNVFDTIRGIASDLRSGDSLGASSQTTNLNLRLDELTQGQDRLLNSLGKLGA